MFKIKVTEYGYGFFPGGDPRLFTPDSEGTTAEELENHRKACAAWDAGENRSDPDCIHAPGIILTRCQFGLGSYEWTEELWPWEWVRYVWWPHLCNRAWWWWNMDALAIAESRLIRAMLAFLRNDRNIGGNT